MVYDLVAVGTGFASSFFLKKYLENCRKTDKILVLERGPFKPHADRIKNAQQKPMAEVGYITGGDGGRLYKNVSPSKSWMFDPSFGGSSNCWTGCTPRFLPSDFKLQSIYGVGMDWPLTYEDLEPYYTETEQLMRISGPSKTPFDKSEKYPLPPHALSTVDELMQQKYGNHYISQPTARSSVQEQRNKCCTSAICHLCPVDAKFTIENGFKRSIYQDDRVKVIYNAEVTGFELNNNTVEKLYYVHDNKDYVVKSDLFSLGANAIFNAHLLLSSGDTNKNTGKYLSEQVGYYCYVNLDNFNNVGGSSIITANGYMLYEGEHRSQYAACLIESHNDVFVRFEQGKWRSIAKFKFVFEDIPNVANHVSIQPENKLPIVNHPHQSSYVKKAHANLKTRLNSLFDCLPVENISLDEKPQPTEAHILGTTRMGNSIKDSVIDKNLIHHKYRNLLVLGGSSFPSISPANPTLTLSALSLKAADSLFK